MNTKGQYSVIEIFDSIQGEGSNIGEPATFIRLAGCNLRCPWCDTMDSWSAENAISMSAQEIISQCSQGLVVITGGEPLIWNLVPLTLSLGKLNKRVAIETNGTIALPFELEMSVGWVTASPKPPKYALNCKADELKFVVDDDNYEKVLAEISTIRTKHTRNRKGLKIKIWLQPEGSQWEHNIKRCYSMAMLNPHLELTVGIQLHKIMEVR